MFILSSVAGGIAMSLLLTIIVDKIQNKSIISRDLQFHTSRIASISLLAYLYLKLWDWAATSYYSHSPGASEALARLHTTTPYTQTFWWVEIIPGGIIPVIIFLHPQLRKNDHYLMAALGLIIVGVTIKR